MPRGCGWHGRGRRRRAWAGDAVAPRRGQRAAGAEAAASARPGAASLGAFARRTGRRRTRPQVPGCGWARARFYGPGLRTQGPRAAADGGRGQGRRRMRGTGGAGRGRSLWLVRRNLGPRGRPLLRLPPSTGACPEPRPSRLSLGAVWRSRPGPQRHWSSGCFAGGKAPPGGTWGAPSPQRGRVGASPTGSVSRDSRGSPRLGIPRPQQTDPQGRAPGGCGPAGEAHWRVS